MAGCGRGTGAGWEKPCASERGKTEEQVGWERAQDRILLSHLGLQNGSLLQKPKKKKRKEKKKKKTEITNN